MWTLAAPLQPLPMTELLAVPFWHDPGLWLVLLTSSAYQLIIYSALPVLPFFVLLTDLGQSTTNSKEQAKYDPVRDDPN